VTGSILKRIASGEKAAVEECITTFGGLIWSLARRFTYTQADAEDAVQDIFIDLWKNAARYDPDVAMEVTFVTMIARRRLIDRLRQNRRHHDTEAITDELSNFLADPKRPDREVELCADAATAVKAMEQLRPEQQKIIQLAVFHGMTHQEIADLTGTPLGTVKSHVRRGLLHIREALGVKVTTVAKESSS
jgi:RNA polymerase sigma-70 factor (ECF subfamily)